MNPLVQPTFHIKRFYCNYSMPSRPVRFVGFRDADKENRGPPIHSVQDDDSDEDEGPILYRDDEEPLEEEGIGSIK